MQGSTDVHPKLRDTAWLLQSMEEAQESNSKEATKVGNLLLGCAGCSLGVSFGTI